MGSSQISTLVMFVAIFAVMYFMVIRPQKKQQQAAKDMRDGLKVGDRIVTIGGIVAEIIGFEGEENIIVSSRGSEMLFKRKAVARKDEADTEKVSEKPVKKQADDAQENDKAFEIMGEKE